jgi:hypothetical protein
MGCATPAGLCSGLFTYVAKYKGMIVGRRTSHVPYTHALILQRNEEVEREGHDYSRTDPIRGIREGETRRYKSSDKNQSTPMLGKMVQAQVAARGPKHLTTSEPTCIALRLTVSSTTQE